MSLQRECGSLTERVALSRDGFLRACCTIFVCMGSFSDCNYLNYLKKNPHSFSAEYSNTLGRRSTYERELHMGSGERWVVLEPVYLLFHILYIQVWSLTKFSTPAFLFFPYFLSPTVGTAWCWLFSCYIGAMVSLPFVMVSFTIHSLIIEPWSFNSEDFQITGVEELWSGSSPWQLLTFWSSSVSWRQLQGRWPGQHFPFLTSSTGAWFLCCSEESRSRKSELTNLLLLGFCQNEGGFVIPK